MKLKMFFVLGLFLMSFSTYSDTYIAIFKYTCGVTNAEYVYSGSWFVAGYSYNSQSACVEVFNAHKRYPTNGGFFQIHPAGSNSVVYFNAVNSPYQSSGGSTGQKQCPGGGTVSGANCINALACVAPQVRSSTTGMCEEPACAPPKFVNSFGICEVPECTTYKVPNELTGACQIPPSCGSTEQYINSTNTCILKSLNCPGHSHANIANDICLPDAPNVCPVGQHDDGTYNCIADDPQHCKINQQSGYINGVLQCINHPNLDTQQQAAVDAVLNSNNSAAAADLAAQNAQNLINASNADPTDLAKAAAADNAKAEANTARQKADSEAQQTANKNAELANGLLANIDASTADSNNREKSKQATAGGDSCDEPPACTGDAIQCEILKQSHRNSCRSQVDAKLSDKEIGGNSEKIAGVFSTGIAADFGIGAFNNQAMVSTSFFNLGSGQCQGVPMNYKLLQYSFNPCDGLAVFRNLLGWFFYVYTAFSIVNLARETK